MTKLTQFEKTITTTIIIRYGDGNTSLDDGMTQLSIKQFGLWIKFLKLT